MFNMPDDAPSYDLYDLVTPAEEVVMEAAESRIESEATTAAAAAASADGADRDHTQDVANAVQGEAESIEPKMAPCVALQEKEVLEIALLGEAPSVAAAEPLAAAGVSGDLVGSPPPTTLGTAIAVAVVEAALDVTVEGTTAVLPEQQEQQQEAIAQTDQDLQEEEVGNRSDQ